ncbi:MAG: hypothetical protein Q9160_000076 [Pyrenula sp. 1 TL-2023]
MRQCLTSPDGGYYTSHRGDADQFGRHGDFITSPDISQVFGELVGLWVLTEWLGQGRTSHGVQLVELGPGRGTLMDDMLRTLVNFQPFTSAIDSVYLIEASSSLREKQRRLLCGENAFNTYKDIGWEAKSKYSVNKDPSKPIWIRWLEDMRHLPRPTKEASTPFIIAHEFFDALPIHAFTSVAPAAEALPTLLMADGRPAAPQPSSAKRPQWRELMVSPARFSGGQEKQKSNGPQPDFELTTAKASTPSSLVIPQSSARYAPLLAIPGSTVEVSPESQTTITDLARRIGGTPGSSVSSGGAALVIDYGPSSTIPINSLRGIQHHRRVPPFLLPGQVDLSADVDFTALADAALAASPNVEVHGPVDQADFLTAMGIEERARQLMEGLKGKGQEAEERRKVIDESWKRLVDRSVKDGMGRIYKAMAVVPESGGKRRPVGFGGDVASA